MQQELYRAESQGGTPHQDPLYVSPRKQGLRGTPRDLPLRDVDAQAEIGGRIHQRTLVLTLCARFQRVLKGRLMF